MGHQRIHDANPEEKIRLMSTFVGHLHPVLVHLPIGILLLGLLLQWLSLWEKNSSFKAAADLAILIGFLTALLSCCTGYVLSLGGDYPSGLVATHQWMAISMTILSGLLYATLRGRRMGPVAGCLSIAVLALLLVTGHLGGSLTHGTGYLSFGEENLTPILRPVPNVQAAVAYTALVQPVLHDNCYRCHSASTKKGGLRLDLTTWNGKDGPVIIPGQADASLLIKRVLLPEGDEHHMAPSGKQQLTKAEVALLRWWIDGGASMDKTVSSLPQDSSMRTVLTAFAIGTAGPVAEGPSNIADSSLPASPVKPASAEALRRLSAAGALVLPVSSNSNYLSISFPYDTIGRDALAALSGVHDQLVSLQCSFTPLGDSALPIIAGCTHLVRLWLDHTMITGKTLGSLSALTQLRYLNLTGTTVANLDALKTLPNLRSLYVYQTHVDKSGWAALQAGFPHTVLDSGGYGMPFLSSDTAIVRAPARP
jgi:uncharacterized membrane protein